MISSILFEVLKKLYADDILYKKRSRGMNDKNSEVKNLNYTIFEYTEALNDSKLRYQNVYKFYLNPDEAEEDKKKLKRKIEILEKNILNPYFARIDFFNERDNVKDICYIGKIGLMNYDNKIITIDWRAPIASIYYDSNIGDASYKVGDDIIYGRLELKRQYNIENKVLISFNDVDTVSNDELLKPYLGVNADKRLKNIVSTIQAEQNEIIRSNINKNLIVQGVAGSGKTTVALHRIAYLVYTYREHIKSNQYLVIGPNKFFINYISSVLPDLETYDVEQCDLLEFTEKYLNKKINIVDGYTSNSKYKSSLEYKNKIDEYLQNYIKLPNKSILIDDFELLNYDFIKKIWDDVENRKYETLNNRVARTILELEKYLDDNYNNIVLSINNYYDGLLLTENLDKVRKLRTKVLDMFKLSKKSILKKYFENMNYNVLKIYASIEKTDVVQYEDIPALLYINYKIYGNEKYIGIKHTVIDEAQDYNTFVFYVLKKILERSTFSIYGDLAQSLYSYRSLENWSELDNILENAEIKYLNKSYRTSIEIMNEANKINKKLNLSIAEAVIRHSDKVIYQRINDKYIDIEYNINIFIKKGYKSIAIITKNDVESTDIYEKLGKKYNINLINDCSMNYTDGITIITSRLSKGLEFDSVILTNLDNYNENSIMDLKLLYVAMTRAMHSLTILYDKSINSFLLK